MRTVHFSLALVLLSGVFVADIRGQSATSKPSRSSIEVLIRHLRAKDPAVRVRAAETLYEWGADAAPAATALVDALADRDDKVREAVVETLTAIGPLAFRPLATLVKGRDTDMRLLALDVCSRIGSGRGLQKDERKDLSPVLVECLNDKNPAIRYEAACCLGDVREVSSVPQLIKLLEKEKDISVRQAAVMTCLSFGEDAKAAVPVLAKMVVEEFHKQHGYGNGGSIGTDAALALSNIGEPAVSALACIVLDVKLKMEIRRTALDALRRMSGRAKFAAAAPAICKALLDPDETMRCRAAATLGKMETADADVRAALLVATKDKSLYVRLEAAESLYRFDHQNPIVLTTILPALYDKEATIRESACFTLDRIGAPVATPTIPRLIVLLSDENNSVRLHATYALTTMAGQKANIAAAVPALKLATSDPDWSIRHASQECLKRVKR